MPVAAEQFTRAPEPTVASRVTVLAVIIIPLLAVLAAVPVAWNRWISWLDIALALNFYVVAACGITVGYVVSPEDTRACVWKKAIRS